MQRQPFKALLWEADGKRHEWTVTFGDTPKDEDGHDWGTYDLDRRIITVYWRLRNREQILDTLLHEGAHAASGVNADEHLIEAIEDNYTTLREAFRRQDA